MLAMLYVHYGGISNTAGSYKRIINSTCNGLRIYIKRNERPYVKAFDSGKITREIQRNTEAALEYWHIEQTGEDGLTDIAIMGTLEDNDEKDDVISDDEHDVNEQDSSMSLV